VSVVRRKCGDPIVSRLVHVLGEAKIPGCTGAVARGSVVWLPVY
jgi:hypothetical protein